jgi:putative tryptophan/tyrosine transport system substrate-binding protein
MRRALLICAVLAVLSPNHADAAERVWRLGVLSLADGSAMRSVVLPYLATRGFVEGRNLHVDVREGTEDQMPALAEALVADKADVIIATSDWAVHAARAATSIIPIIAAPMGADPVLAGVAESWAKTHISRGTSKAGVTRDDLSQPVLSGPRRAEKGAS